MLQDLDIGHSVLLAYVQNMSETVEVKAVQPLFLSCICCLGLAAVNKCTNDASLVHMHLGFHCQETLVP